MEKKYLSEIKKLANILKETCRETDYKILDLKNKANYLAKINKVITKRTRTM